MTGKLPAEMLDRDWLSQRLERFDYTVLAFGHWDQQESGQSKDDVLGSFKLAMLTAGRCRVSAGELEYEVGRGDVLLFAPFVRNHVRCLEGERAGLYYLYFDLRPLSKRREFTDLFHCRSLGCYPGLMPEFAFPQLERTTRTAAQGAPGGYYGAKLVLQRMLMHLLENEREAGLWDAAPVSTAEEQVVDRCVEYLDGHVEDRVRVSDLAAALNLSQSYLCRCVLHTLDKSTKELILTHKLRLVERELRSGGAGVEELAARYGFSSGQTLSAAFKQHYRATPLAHRRKHCGWQE